MNRSKLLNIILTLIIIGLSLVTTLLLITDDYYQERAQLYEKLLSLNYQYVGRNIQEVKDSLNITDSVNSEYYIAFPNLDIPGIEHQDYYGIAVIVKDGKVRHLTKDKP